MDPNYFGEQKDLDILVDGIKIALKLGEQDALKPYNFVPSKVNVPPCDDLEYASDEYWECYIKQNTGPENHQIGRFWITIKIFNVNY